MTVLVIERLGPSADVPDAGFLDRVVRSQFAEQRRADRVRRGQPARPARDDGPAGLVLAAIDELDTGPMERDWLVALFRMVRNYPYKPGRTIVGWPLESWSADRSAHFGGIPVTPGQVAADIRLLMEVASGVAGAAWVHTQILRPLTSLANLPVELPERADGLSVEDNALLVLFASVFVASRGAGRSTAAAWRAARDVVGSDGADGSRAMGGRPASWMVELLEQYVDPPTVRIGRRSASEVSLRTMDSAEWTTRLLA